jgi:hypothetical protein
MGMHVDLVTAAERVGHDEGNDLVLPNPRRLVATR